MMTKHICHGDAIDETHDCWCDEGHDHPASWHRAEIRERARLEAERAALVASQN